MKRESNVGVMSALLSGRQSKRWKRNDTGSDAIVLRGLLEIQISSLITCAIAANVEIESI
jgi:hypothetical protein